MKKTFDYAQQPPPAAIRSSDEWAKSGKLDKEPTHRLTIDVPVELHRRIRWQSAKRGKKIREELIELLMEKYPEEEAT